MTLRSALLLASAIFVLTVLARLPATLLVHLLPADVQCQTPGGTLWQGSCGEIRSGEIDLAGVRWRLQPLSLLQLRAVLDVQSDDARAAGQARLTVRTGGRLEIRDLQAVLPLRGGLTPFPASWDGELGLALTRAEVQNGRFTALQGTITARQLRSARPAAELGSFALEFPATADSAAGPAPMNGELHDLGGPLSIQGQLRLTAAGSYELSGSVALRDPSNTGLQQMLQLLGPADAQGRYAFAVSGTL